MQHSLDDIKFILKDSSSKVLIDKVLKKTPLESTKKIYLSDSNGNTIGPFIQKEIDVNSGIGGIYSILEKDQNATQNQFPTIYKYKKENKKIAIIEEYIDGLTLEEFLTNTHTKEELLLVMISLCVALKSLHEDYSRPIIHRDIKPTNIIVTKDGKAKLIDFGIARIYDEPNKNSNIKDSTTSGNQYKERDTKVFGTVGFAPPEQFGFSQTTPQSDIYSLGKVLVLMFENCQDQTKYWNKLKHAICDKCCSLDPKNRFNKVDEIIALLSSSKTLSKKQIEVALSDTKIISKLSIGKIIYNTIIIAAFVWLTTCAVSIFLLPNGSNVIEKGWSDSIIGFIITVVFVFLPAAFLLLNKTWIYKKFPQFPKITKKRTIIIICVCVVCILFLLMLNEIMKV